MAKETDEDQFRMVCPKCGSTSFTVRRDQRTYVHKSQPFELVFSCRCGKQIFGGEIIQKEYDRQKAEWEKRPREESDDDDDDRLRQEEEARRREQLRKAMEYRRTYLAEKRRKQADAERQRKEAEDRRWRERVAKVEAEHGADTAYLEDEPASRKSKPAFTTRTVAQPAVPDKPKKKKKKKPKKKPAAAKTTETTSSAATPAPTANPATITFDENHPHAEFMAYLAEGTFGDLFPECTPPDIKGPHLCVWPPCEKPRRKKSKYCSRECSNKNARWRHKQRKKTN